MTITRRVLLSIAVVVALSPAFGAADASDALLRWTEAVFPNGAPGKIGSVVLRGDATFAGVPGRFEEWLDSGARRIVNTEGARSQEDVFAAGRGWTKDWNGKVRELAGRDLKDAVTAEAIDALVFGGAVRDVVAGKGVELVPSEAGTTAGTVLRFTPEGGLPFDLTLDPGTGLPAKVSRKPYDDVVTLAFADWKLAGGMLIPFSVRESSGDDEGEATIAVREAKTSKRRSGVKFARPADGPRDYRFAKGASAPAIPFHFGNNHVMVEARVNGSKPLWFLVDTGAELTIVNKPRLKEMGLELYGESSITGGGGSADFAYTDVQRMDVGGVAMLGQRAGVMDLHGLEKIYGMPMGGLLGYDFLSRVVVRVDYDTNTLDLFEPSSFTYKGSGVSVPFILEGARPHVTATIAVPSAPPIAADMIVDVGAAGTVNLTSPFVKANRLLELARKTPAGAPRTMAGSEKEFFAQTSVPGKLAGFKLGSVELKDVPTSLMMQTTGAYAAESFAGTIGQGVLSRFNTFYDYTRGTMILEPRAELLTPFAPNPSIGATLLSDGPDYTVFTVTGVGKGSPAETAGLKKGDVVTAVDGTPASELTLERLRKLLVEAGAHRVVEVRRGEETVKLEFTVTLAAPPEL